MNQKWTDNTNRANKISCNLLGMATNSEFHTCSNPLQPPVPHYFADCYFSCKRKEFIIYTMIVFQLHNKKWRCMHKNEICNVQENMHSSVKGEGERKQSFNNTVWNKEIWQLQKRGSVSLSQLYIYIMMNFMWLHVSTRYESSSGHWTYRFDQTVITNEMLARYGIPYGSYVSPKICNTDLWECIP
jgi:hypothetical protein